MSRFQLGIHRAIGLVLGVCLLSQAAPNAVAQFSARGLIGGSRDVGDTATPSRQSSQPSYNPGSRPPPFKFDLGDLFKPQPGGGNNNQGFGTRNRGNDNDSGQYYQPQQPRYLPAQPKITVRTNAVPKRTETIQPLAENTSPTFGDGFNLTDPEIEIVKENTRDNANDELDAWVTELGPGAETDPATKAAVDNIRTKIANGEAVTLPDIARVDDAAMAANLGFDADKAKKHGEQIIEDTEALAILESEGDGEGGAGATIEIGPLKVILFPGLPEDDMATLEDGSVIIGTGGEGEISTVSMEAADVFGASVGVGEPVPDAAGDVAARIKDGVLIMNPIENGQAVEYIVANTNYKMEPSFTQHLPPGRTWVIEFDRGEGHGTACYTLTDGTYAFGPSDKGWDLYRQTLSVTIDNSGNESAFNYNIDNTQCVLAVGDSKVHTSSYPLLVRFDRGNGEESQKKVVARNAHYRVGVDRRDGLWELFPADSMEGSVAALKEVVGEEPALAATPKTLRPAKESDANTSKARSARLRALMLMKAKQE